MEINEFKEPSMVSLLLGPKMLFKLAIAWILIVLVGSGLAIWVVNNTSLNNGEIENILGESERLAYAANVSFEDSQPVETSTVALYPTRMVIPKLGTDLPINNPQTRNIALLDEELKTGAVRYPDSATLGVDGGNVLLFGHSSGLPAVRNKFFKAFNGIETLKYGDSIEITSGSDRYTYKVSRVYRASASDDRIELQVPGQRLTLLTCNSFGSRVDRWIVEADLVGKNI